MASGLDLWKGRPFQLLNALFFNFLYICMHILSRVDPTLKILSVTLLGLCLCFLFPCLVGREWKSGTSRDVINGCR
jgi:uncharacterized membrane protein YjgN (DUF898 family)